MVGVAPADVDCNESAGSTTVGSATSLWKPGQTGIRWYDDNRGDTTFVTVFTPWRESEDLSDVPDNGRSDAEEQQLAAQKTAVHEIGHVLNIGEADDDGNDEVYSGDSPDDETPEAVIESPNSLFPVPRQRWSVMSKGNLEYQYISPIEGRYFSFSIEELLTISSEDEKVDQ